MNKIHYDTSNAQRCSYAGECTTDRALVTCKNCIRRMNQEPLIGRSKKAGGRNKIGVVISDRAFARWEKIPKGERSKRLSDWLEKQ